MQTGRYFEDLPVGQRFLTPGVSVTEESIIRFALEWDFQPFHVDREAAKNSIYGGLVASGLHSLALTFRLCNQAGFFGGGAVAGLGYAEVRYSRPVRPGDTLRAELSVVSKRLSASRPGFGVVEWDVRSRNQAGEEVLSFRHTILVACSPAP